MAPWERLPALAGTSLALTSAKRTEVSQVEQNINSSLVAKLNQSTPYAPGDASEAADRVAAAHSAPSTPPAQDGNSAVEVSLHPNENSKSGLSRVYVPTTRPVRLGEDPEYELRVMEDGTAGIAVYTSINRLRECLGNAQPWSEASLLELLYLVGKKRIGVALNPHVDPNLKPTATDTF